MKKNMNPIMKTMKKAQLKKELKHVILLNKTLL